MGIDELPETPPEIMPGLPDEVLFGMDQPLGEPIFMDGPVGLPEPQGIEETVT